MSHGLVKKKKYYVYANG